MRWLRRRSGPRDAGALWSALKSGTYEDFLVHYDEAWVDHRYADQNLLALALTNHDPRARVQMATRLLDDGATVGPGHPLHLLLSQREHDPEREAPLLARLIEAGGDVNEVVPGGRVGAPIEALAGVPALSDDDLAPFYDVLFARPDLDLEQHGAFGRPVIDGFRAKGEKREALTRRAEAYLAERSC